MNLPDELLSVFAETEQTLMQQAWCHSDWFLCSGHWDDPRYTDTVVLKLSKRNWTSVEPLTLCAGGEIHYAAWIDEKSLKRRELQFGMHVFGYPMISSRHVRKKDFTDWFRSKHAGQIKSWGFHTTSRGPQVPYAGIFKFKAFEELKAFMTEDFGRFASLADSIDQRLSELKAIYDGELS